MLKEPLDMIPGRSFYLPPVMGSSPTRVGQLPSTAFPTFTTANRKQSLVGASQPHVRGGANKTLLKDMHLY